MPEILIALIHLAGDVLIGALLLFGFAGVLAVWVLPAIWMHPFIALLLFVVAATFFKPR